MFRMTRRKITQVKFILNYMKESFTKYEEWRLPWWHSPQCRAHGLGLLTCIQVSQEAGKVVWYSHLFQNFPQFIVIPTFKDFSVINKAELDVFFLEISCFFYDPVDVGNLNSGSSAFSKSSLNIKVLSSCTVEA